MGGGIRRRAVAVLLSLFLGPGAALAEAPFEKEIAAFEAHDRMREPAEGATLFVGSSSIRLWESLEKDFPSALKVVSRGFGGARLADCVRYAPRLLAPYARRKPRRVVLYAGENDLAEGADPEQTVERFEAFVKQARGVLPATPITFISIKPSPARRALDEKFRLANRLIRARAASRRVDFVDVYSAMVDAKGEPRPELFLTDDGLHMAPAGYALWREKLLPRL